jgi:hypothetical protein
MILDRFWAKVARSGPKACWLWRAGKTRGGYGQFYDGTRTVYAHRFAYEFLVGPIPAGLTIDHLCRNRSCVNPAHLEPVTPGLNVLRGQGVTAMNLRKTMCPGGHRYDYTKPNGGRGCRRCEIAKYRADTEKYGRYQAQWYQENKEHVKRYKAAWYLANKARMTDVNA